MHGSVANVVGSESPQHQTCNPGHDGRQRPGEGEEDVHGRRDRQSHSLGTLERERLWNQLTQDYVQPGDQSEGDGNRAGVCIHGGVRNVSDRRFEQAGEHGLAYPTERQAANGHTQLHAIDDALELLVQLQDCSGTHAAGFNQLLDSRFADADQRKLGRCEERIGCHQEQDEKHPQQHIRNHGGIILRDCGRLQRSELRLQRLEVRLQR